MPAEKKLRAFEDIMEFHAHVAAKGYVALDFYDGSILYDYDKEKVIICDIDLYQKSPFLNVGNLGIVGSARYVSPEECVKDAIMDEITNVYTMGATAFALFAYGDRSPEAWHLSKQMYSVVKQAVSDDRKQRQQSIRQLIENWRTAKICLPTEKLTRAKEILKRRKVYVNRNRWRKNSWRYRRGY